jgi:hypothetical protein
VDMCQWRLDLNAGLFKHPGDVSSIPTQSSSLSSSLFPLPDLSGSSNGSIARTTQRG